MFDARGSEENIRWSKLLSLLAADVFTRARGDKINFVACVRLLWIDTARCINLNQQAAVLKNGCESLAFGSRQTFERFGNGGSDARVIRSHLVPLCFRLLHVAGGRQIWILRFVAVDFLLKLRFRLLSIVMPEQLSVTALLSYSCAQGACSSHDLCVQIAIQIDDVDCSRASGWH